MDLWAEKEAATYSAEDDIDFQTAYVADLLTGSDYPSFDIALACKMFKEWKGHKKENILTYRDREFVSPVTQTKAPKHHTPWLAAMDDSMEAFLADK
jgi:trimethylamine monooxygenase